MAYVFAALVQSIVARTIEIHSNASFANFLGILVECPQNPRNRRGSGTVKERLGSVPPRAPIHDMICFPDLPALHAPTPPIAMDCHYLIDPSCRPHSSHKIVVSTPAMEHKEFLLRHHVVLLTAVHKTRPSNPMAVGKALEA